MMSTIFCYFFNLKKPKRNIIGNNSNLPASISKIKVNLERSDKEEKLPTGPTTPNPGPTLLKQVTTDVNILIKFNESKDKIITEKIKIIK